ncbi:MAG: hypothetical protein QG602_2487 [Verrucomicrobiota bacterium]|nr:hypothetical protein [Verrucomicrobiota bacterium]
MPYATGPASSIALADLSEWLDDCDSETAYRGRECFKQGHVRNLRLDGIEIIADVHGSRPYETRLFWDGDGWDSVCSCPVEVDCIHAHAVGLAWVRQHDRNSASLPPRGSPPPAIPGVTTGAALLAQQADPVAPGDKKKKSSFREEWGHKLAEKLGRAITLDEAHLLGQLSALFHDFKSHPGWLSAHSLTKHGFPVSAEALGGGSAAFSGWLDPAHPPADPWALWQYIAFDWERSGRPIPEIFRPQTDTAPLAARLERQLLARELEDWNRALALRPGADPVYGYQVRAPFEPPADIRLRLDSSEGFLLEVRSAADKPWKFPTAKWLESLRRAGPAELAPLPAPAAALAATYAAECRDLGYTPSVRGALPEQFVNRILAYDSARAAVFLPDGSPWRVEPEPLAIQATVNATNPQRLDLLLVAPDGRSAENAGLLFARPEPHYLHDGRVYRGPPRVPQRQLPVAALGSPALAHRLREIGVRLPTSLEARLRRVRPRPLLRCWIEASVSSGSSIFNAQLFARSDDPPSLQHWSGQGGWQWTDDGAPPRLGPDDPILEFDLTAANAVGARFADFKLQWSGWSEAWARTVTRDFPDQFLDWRATLPPDLTIEAQGELAGLAGPPVRAHLDFSALPAAGESGRDWFDLTVALRVEDTTLDPEEVALLLKARGKWVQLPRHGWRRLELAESAETRATLDRLGLDANEIAATGKPIAHRLHALQLAGEATAFESHDARLAAALRERASQLATVAPPGLPAGLQAELRPYQREGFHFLAHLAANGLGGVLADDMGLGKTVQTLAWLLWLADEKSRAPQANVRNTNIAPGSSATDATVSPPKKRAKPKNASQSNVRITNIGGETPGAGGRPFRALVVCPKSVVHGWLSETERFAPALTVQAFTPAVAKEPQPPGPAAGPALLVTNYAQLRINAAWFQQHVWDAVILDEAQFIKNPTSLTAAVARALATRHRLALTGTPVENRLLDLWSLLAFAQPGLLGTQAAFKRQHPDDDPAAPARLQRRARHFLLRRTKAQVATDLPPRTEDEIVVELEPAQRKLYDAELKRARAQLLGLETDRALDAVRFNILSSLLRLRQICCHPALVDPAHAGLPSAKLDALLERIEELAEEGHQVLVFSQFTGMLDLIRSRLVAANIGHLILTGATENRAALVEKFQTDRTQTVFLLSLKAAGFGLNLTTASYAILYDPWWNPAVEAQAIDRTHRIGQTRPVTAYRLLADDTIEQKIRVLQKEKAALAGSIVQEESLTSVLDLESLKQILG